MPVSGSNDAGLPLHGWKKWHGVPSGESRTEAILNWSDGSEGSPRWAGGFSVW
jgi:hypothetical protein